MRTFLLLVLALSVTGCESIPMATAMTDGPPAFAPRGWFDYCHRHTEDPGCRS
jgi:predicted transglutaminase-like cysteine proteinase